MLIDSPRSNSRLVLRRSILISALSTGVVGSQLACEPTETHTVASPNDGDGDSLRAVIDRVNQASPRSARIEVPSGTYELTRCATQDDSNASGDLDLSADGPVTIAAFGGPVTIRQTCAGERVIDSLGRGTLRLVGVTITGGSITSSEPAQAAAGGGVRTEADLVLERAVVTRNSAVGAPGVSVASGAATAGGAALGGGLRVGGSLRATASELSLNTAKGGAGVDGKASRLIPAAGGTAEGGGAFVVGAVTISDSILRENRATGGNGGGSIDTAVAPGGGGSARGGAIAQRTSSASAVALSDGTLQRNVAQGGGAGALPPSSFPDSGSAPRPSSGDGVGGALAAAGPVTTTRVTATENAALGGTGAVDSVAPAGRARGGAIASDSSVALDTSSFTLNRATSGAAYWRTFGLGCSHIGIAPSAAAGGAVWSASAVRIAGGNYGRNSTAFVDGLRPAPETAGEGGAVFGEDVFVSGATMQLNTATSRGGAVAARRLIAEDVIATENTGGGRGGGAFSSLEDAEVTSCVVQRNTLDAELPSGSGGGGVAAGGKLTITDSLVADNRAENAFVFSNPMHCAVGVILQPYRVEGGGIRAGSVDAMRITVARNDVSSLAENPGFGPLLPAGSGAGAIAAAGHVSLVNATLHRNSVTANVVPTVSVPGGAPWRSAALSALSLSLEQATVTQNLNAPTFDVAQLQSARSAVLAGPGQPVCTSAAASTGYNWFSDASCGLAGPGDQQVPAAFELGVLTDNGGAVPTQLPAPTSVLVDRIPASACPVTEDARGVARPQGGACDIGAVER